MPPSRQPVAKIYNSLIHKNPTTSDFNYLFKALDGDVIYW